MANEKEVGYVYIMTNPCFKDNIIKVGMALNPEKRCQELSTATGIPTKFEIYAKMKTSQYKEVEQALHHILEKVVHKRVNNNREFFELPPEEAFYLMKQLEPFVEDAEITLAKGQIDDTFTVDKNVRQKYEKAENMTLEGYEHYKDNKDLYEAIKQELLKLDENVDIVYKKLYVAFKAKTNFVDIVFQKRALVLTFNIKYTEVNDPKHLLEDVSQKGRWGNGEASIHVTDLTLLEDIVDFAKQALSKQK